MDIREEILKEISELSPVVANIPKRNPFSVPEGYFDQFSDSVLAKIAINQVLKKSPGLPFEVPSGYFEGLADNILTRIKSGDAEKSDHSPEIRSELESIAPLLNRISRTNLYSVPPGYFDTLSPAAFRSRTSGHQAKITGFRTFYLAAAAAVIGFLIIGGGIFLRNHTGKVLKNGNGITARVDIQDSLAGLSDTAIESYLNAQPTAFDLALPAQNVSDPDVNDLLNSTSDEAIRQYLNDNADHTAKKIKGI
jgi:hypothetical protein